MFDLRIELFGLTFLYQGEQGGRSGLQVNHMKSLSPNSFTYSSISFNQIPPAWADASANKAIHAITRKLRNSFIRPSFIELVVQVNRYATQTILVVSRSMNIPYASGLFAEKVLSENCYVS
jgi:hypothetical protein